MIKNYFKIALRNLLRNKLYTGLNITGLTFGLSCFLLIGLFLFDELTFDQQFQNAGRIFRVIEHRKTPTEDKNIAAVSYKLSEESKKSIGEIENTARVTVVGRDNLGNPADQKKFLEMITVANNGLMEIFDFQAVDGSPKTALKEPNSIVIVEELAMRLFGTTKVAGKTLKWDGLEQPFTITAVLKNHPKNSSFTFSSVYSESTYFTDAEYVSDVNTDWSSNGYTVYALLKQNSNPQGVSSKLKNLVYANFKPEQGVAMAFSLQPLQDMHLYSENISDLSTNSNAGEGGSGSVFYIRIFGIVALFVLLIACINYMNLTTAKASNRSKEIGIKKAVGAFRGQLITQFLAESVLITFISLLLAVVVVNLILPFFNDFTNKELSLGFTTDYKIWLITVVAALTTGLLSGSYPAFMLSRFSPILLLKSLKIQNKSDFSLRKGLVIFQFTVSVVMIIATIVLFSQVRFVNNKDLGFNKDLLVVVDINSGKIRDAAPVVLAEFAKLPGVKQVSTTSRVPGEWKTIPTVKIKQAGNTEELKTSHFLGVDEHFARTFEVELVKGKNFAGKADSSSVLLNETAAKMLNITEPSDQVVEIPMRAMGGNFRPLRDNQVFKARVIGIVKDFHFQTLREKIGPMVLGYQQNPVHSIDYYTSRVEAGNIDATLKKMDGIMKKIDGENLFEYHFLDEQLALFYAEDARRQSMLIWAAMATIFIACLGLFGLATYSAEQRVKEIGIRKVLGASIPNLAVLLSKDFLKLVLIANCIAFPVAWWATSKWLQEFAYHIELQWWMFVLAGLAAVMIALATVSFQSIKAALSNPVKSLKSE
ncbi:FtsX-like permease family protein [Emticicia sp. CRIBPO]|uniref:ABC transporter permease n=1 Tax=Emticicia sp. CRIBPO TaxID=2683258 RepID=UPI001412E2CA|nr:ABC transporter permease [Emticicia sp. CRIBPO]NBA85780.1 FtsX-like permease family protein [Emticicia sp. CRIBPO]